MKRLLTLSIALVFAYSGFSQVPERMSYQAVVRNGNDELVKSSPIGMQISILQGSESGTPIYVETHSTSTNINGLATVEIGGGTPVTGTFSDIDWSTGAYFIKTETDPSGGTSYSITGASQLLSVPYALYAKNVENLDAIMQKLQDLEDIVITQLPLPTDGLVAHYPFNGNANDESGSGLNGVANGAILTTDRFGNANSAYSFAENQDITVPNSQDQNLYPISISLWYNVASISDNQFINIFSKYSPASWNGYQILAADYRNVDNQGVYLNNGYGTSPWYIRSPDNKVLGYYNEDPFLQQFISFNTWYHYVFVLDETGGKIYVDGQLIDSHSWTGTSGSCNNSFEWKIGGLYNGWYNGKIDDIRIYNRGLSEIEIQQLYNEDEYPNTIVTDIDGNSYNTVKIGTQTWMTENLKTTRYSDGTAIPLVNNNTTWSELTMSSKAYCWYNDNEGNKNIYGALYTWAAAMNGESSSAANPSSLQGVCPTGWHLPSVAEWDQLTTFMIANGYNYDGTTTDNKIAKSMASISGWQSTSIIGSAGNTDYPDKRNSSGFNAFPGGLRYPNGTSQLMGLFSFWWSATEFDADRSWRMEIYYSNLGAGTLYVNEAKRDGLAVRCVKD